MCKLWELAVVAAALVEEGNDENSPAYPLNAALRAYLRGRRLPGSQGLGHGNAGQLHFKGGAPLYHRQPMALCGVSEGQPGCPLPGPSGWGGLPEGEDAQLSDGWL